MKTKRTVKIKKSGGILNNLQYIISIIISILFLLELIPFQAKYITPIILIFLAIQIIISIFRARLLNILIELLLIIISILAVIPILGYLFRIIGFLGAILEISTFKNNIYYEKIEIITIKKFKTRSKRKDVVKKKNNNNIIDVESE